MNLQRCSIVSLVVIFSFLVNSVQPQRQWAVRLKDLKASWFGGDEKRHVSNEEEARSILKDLGYHVKEKVNIGSLEGYYLIEEDMDSVVKRNEADGTFETVLVGKRSLSEHESILSDAESIEWFEQQISRHRYRRQNVDVNSFNDPLFPEEWYLGTRAAADNGFQADFGVRSLWQNGINGTGVTIAVVDDGVETGHPDLKDSYVPELSYDFNAGGSKITIQHKVDNHGTRCAGQIVAKPNNNICGVGLAFGSKISGLRLISDSIRDADEAKALTYYYDRQHIFSNSWGPSDDGMSIEGPGSLTKRALVEGTSNGRSGLGSIYIFASGNGKNGQDNCNYDGYANSIYTITVGAVSSLGRWPYYGERCASQLVSAFSGDGRQLVATTDINLNCADPPCCTTGHSGTSASAPFISAIVALMISQRPSLSWRDVQYILVNSADSSITDNDWVTNGAGYKVNDKFGFGIARADKVLTVTLKHERVPAMGSYSAAQFKGATSINAGQTLELPINVNVPSTSLLTKESILTMEYAQLYVDIEHPARSKLRISLISAQKTYSLLAEPRPQDDSTSGIRRWTFSTARTWGESPNGTWSIKIEDLRQSDLNLASGRLNEWELILYGISCKREDWVAQADPYIMGFKCPWEYAELERAQERSKQILIISCIGGTIMLLLLISLGWFYRKRLRKWFRAKQSVLGYGKANLNPMDSIPLKSLEPYELDEKAFEVAISRSAALAGQNTPQGAANLFGTQPKTSLPRSISSPSLLRSNSQRKLNIDIVVTGDSGRASPEPSRLKPVDMGQLPSPLPTELVPGRKDRPQIRLDIRQEALVSPHQDMLDSPKSPNAKKKYLQSKKGLPTPQRK